MKEIKQLEEKILTTSNNEQNNENKLHKEMISKKQELEQIYEYRVNGSILRARAIHIEQNEKK